MSDAMHFFPVALKSRRVEVVRAVTSIFVLFLNLLRPVIRLSDENNCFKIPLKDPHIATLLY
jgi:hypothetical protein